MRETEWGLTGQEGESGRLEGMAGLNSRWRDRGSKIGRRQGTEKGGPTGTDLGWDRGKTGEDGMRQNRERDGQTAAGKGRQEDKGCGEGTAGVIQTRGVEEAEKKKRKGRGGCWCSDEMRKQAQDRQTESDPGK